ncbi:glycosyltransferase [Patescibacteria group bacterium]|nr:glycosyltransferase [Patescibacteria group bacterium]
MNNPPNRKKILFLITKSNWGGAQRYVFDLATSLQNSFDVAVALGGNGKLAEVLQTRNIKTLPIADLKRDVSLTHEWKAFLNLYRLLRTERPDILHLNSSKAGVLGALAGRLARVPHIIFTAHGWAWNENRSLVSKICIAALHWITVILSDRTIAVSHNIYDQMARFPFTRRRMRVIHLGITPLPNLSREQARQNILEIIPGLKEDRDGLWVSTIAELHPIKGFFHALPAIQEAQKKYPGLRYIIFGEGEERLKIEDYIQKNDLTETVCLAGYVHDASALLPAFDLFILPSFSESFGYVLVEAGAVEVPIIATNVGGIPEIVEENAGVLVEPGNTEALAHAIVDALGNTKKMRASARTLKQRVLTHFTKERMSEETADIYTDLLTKR